MQMFGLVLLLAVAAAAPTEPTQYYEDKPQIKIVSQTNTQDNYGNYEYGYDQTNGQKVQESGRFQHGSEPGTGKIEQQGSYEFVGDDGNTYKLTYVANEYGFQPQGSYLPVAPRQLPEYAQLEQKFPDLFHPKSGDKTYYTSSTPSSYYTSTPPSRYYTSTPAPSYTSAPTTYPPRYGKF